MKSRAIFLLLFGFTTTICALSVGQQRRVGDTVARAIEMTKRRQAFDNTGSASNGDVSTNVSIPPQTLSLTARQKKANPKPVKTEPLDVKKLNNLLKTVDKTWIMPRTGSREPIGSNFQYKKTCSSIYKGRTGACQQIGFGVMCFNYCYELGEELNFRCQDISEPSYCKGNSNYETFFTKHKKDAYKVKAFIHQMISRCYATAICNSGAILNTTVTNKSAPPGGPKMIKEISAAPAIQPGTRQSSRAIPTKGKSTNTKDGTHQRTSKQTIWDRYAVSSRQENQPPPLQPNAGIIGPPEIENEFEGQPKYVPFWQRLLKRKNSTSTQSTTKRPNQKTTTIESTKIGPDDLSQEEDELSIKDKGDEVLPDEEHENLAAEDEDEEEMLIAVATTTISPPTTTTRKPKRRRLKPARMTQKAMTSKTTTTQIPYEIVDEEEYPDSEITQKRYTWKPLEVKSTPTTSTQTPCRADDKVESPGSTANQDASPLEGFWSKFQPNKWFNSIHFMTNTG